MSDQSPIFGIRSAAVSDVEHGHRFMPKFNQEGLIPAIVTDAVSGDVLMFAWMNAEALARSIDTRQAWFWSRSRKAFWRKGEDSGNTLAIVEMRTDCDQDVVLIRATLAGAGVACHTGARSCFYRTISLGTGASDSDNAATAVAPSGGNPRDIALVDAPAVPKQ